MIAVCKHLPEILESIQFIQCIRTVHPTDHCVTNDCKTHFESYYGFREYSRIEIEERENKYDCHSTDPILGGPNELSCISFLGD